MCRLMSHRPGTAKTVEVAATAPKNRGGDDDILARDELLLATLAAASLCSRVVMGPARANAGNYWATASSLTARSTISRCPPVRGGHLTYVRRRSIPD